MGGRGIGGWGGDVGRGRNIDKAARLSARDDGAIHDGQKCRFIGLVVEGPKLTIF